MNKPDQFADEVRRNIEGLARDTDLQAMSRVWARETAAHKYTYNFTWLGRPIIQFPQDMVAVQEIIWRTQPDLIIETGIAHGGSLIFSASMLELNAACGGPSDARVLGIDIDIRSHNREAILAHPLSRRVDMIQGSSIAPDVVGRVREAARGKKSVLVLLDSNHTHDHVLAELEAYAPLTTVGNYCVVFDTLVEDMPESFYGDRPWRPGNSPKTAVRQFLGSTSNFQVDKTMEHKLLITVAPDGYLLRVN
jgi:cephalosporin hydroxylase